MSYLKLNNPSLDRAWSFYYGAPLLAAGSNCRIGTTTINQGFYSLILIKSLCNPL
jgi:hypothetical protein